MLSGFMRVFQSGGSNLRSRIIGIYTLLIGFNVAAWALAFYGGARLHDPTFVATGLIAYGLGLRHAVDADHISAIDNVTRKLMQDGKRPVGVGTFFSLGHSTVVILLSAALAAASLFVQKNLPSLENAGGLIGTSVSALFLYLIAALNIIILLDIFKTFRTVTRGGEYNEQKIEDFLNQRGFLARFFRPLFRFVKDSWLMYPVGFLFGLGFDTASEVGLLAISAISAKAGTPFLFIMVFALLFTAGMCLADTTDGIMMLGAYGWAFVKPIRKLYYNLNITLISVLVAVLIGTIEVMQIVSGELQLGGPFWDFVNNTLSLGNLGFYIVGIFAVSWLISTFVYRVKKYEHIEVNVAGANADEDESHVASPLAS
ncbi:MAG TPA: HoxN/HupN/NixA family nickel/cobalt transporter [Ktedonobacterales bacterium]|nr:HoxN/HupN/NixA family nickel/cobalt transporter [Ktedonobacterales bacterium]